MSRRSRSLTRPGQILGVLAITALPVTAQEVIELPAEDRLLDAGFDELYRVGSLLGGDWDTFGRVVDVAFDGSGNLYVLDTQAARISVVDLQGNLVRRFGRVGEGPGEFDADASGVQTFTVLHDGRAAVHDPGRGHFVLFGSNGEFERLVPLAGTTFTMFPGLQADPASASMVSTGKVTHRNLTPGAGEDEAEPSFVSVMRYDVSGAEVWVETAATGWKPPEDYLATSTPEFSAGALPDGGVAFIDSSAYRVKIAAPGGGLARILTRPFPAVPVTDDMRTAHIERNMADLEGMAERDPSLRGGERPWSKSCAPGSNRRCCIPSCPFCGACEQLRRARSGPCAAATISTATAPST